MDKSCKKKKEEEEGEKKESSCSNADVWRANCNVGLFAFHCLFVLGGFNRERRAEAFMLATVFAGH